MFETLEDKIEKSKNPLDPGLPILIYGATTAVSSVVFILRVQAHGFSHLFSLVGWAAMFLLSLTWLVTSFRSSVPITRRDFGVRIAVLCLLLMVQRLPSIWR
jgi:hypothetical protein